MEVKHIVTVLRGDDKLVTSFWSTLYYRKSEIDVYKIGMKHY